MLQKLVAGVLVVIGATMAFGLIAIAGKDGHSAASVAGAFVVSSLGPIGAGVMLWRHAGRGALVLAAARRDADRTLLLRLAEKSGGALTVVEVMTRAGWSAPRAEEELDRLCRQGLAEHQVGPDGTLVYRVRALLSAAEKQGAKSVLEDEP